MPRSLTAPPWKGDAAVAASAVAFGLTIPLGKLALDDGAGAWTAVAVRFLVGGMLLVPFAARRRPPGDRGGERGELCPVLVSSVALLTGYVLLTLGLDRTTSTAAGFISYLLVVIVPLLASARSRRLPSSGLALGIGIVLIGLLLLNDIDTVGAGEALCLGAAIAFSFHVLLVGAYAPGQDAVRFACGQLLAVGVAAAPVAVVLDGPASDGLGWMLSTALVGCVALSLQLAGQQSVGPSRTSLLLMIDPVVAAAGGYWLGERIGWTGLAGCTLILLGVGAGELLDRPVNQGEDNNRYERPEEAPSRIRPVGPP